MKLSLMFVIFWEIRARRRVFVVATGSCDRDLDDSMQNAVAIAENRPVYSCIARFSGSEHPIGGECTHK